MWTIWKNQRIQKLRFSKKNDCDKVLRHKTFNIPKNPKCDGYQRGFASMVYKVFYKKVAGSSVNIDANKSAFNNEKLAEELHKSIIRKFKNSGLFRI